MTAPLFCGLSAFPITPTDGAGALIETDFAAIIERICSAGADSIGVLGSTGGFAYLDRITRRRTIALAVATSRGRVPIIAGIGALRTDAAIALAHDALEAGADAVLLPPMSYTPLTASEVETHFQAVAQATPLPLCIYNNPGTTRFTFTHDLLARMATLPMIAAVKMPPPVDGDFAAELARLRDGPVGALRIGYSADWALAPALSSGADAFYSGLAGVLPDAFVALAKVAQAGDAAAIAAANARFALLWELAREFGGLRLSFAIARVLGLTTAEMPLPLLPIPSEQSNRIEQALSAISGAG